MNLTESILCAWHLSFNLGMWFETAFFERVWSCTFYVFSQKRLASSVFTNSATETGKARLLSLSVAAFLKTYRLVRRYCTSLTIVVRKTELWSQLAPEWLMMVRITDITLVLRFDFVARFAVLKSFTTACPIRAGILAICLHTVSSSLADERDWVGRALGTGISTNLPISVRMSKVSSPSFLRIGAVTSSSTPPNDWGTICGFSAEVFVAQRTTNNVACTAVRKTLWKTSHRTYLWTMHLIAWRPTQGSQRQTAVRLSPTTGTWPARTWNSNTTYSF